MVRVQISHSECGAQWYAYGYLFGTGRAGLEVFEPAELILPRKGVRYPGGTRVTTHSLAA
eukprot:1310278-Rhodomonas_salina.2